MNNNTKKIAFIALPIIILLIALGVWFLVVKKTKAPDVSQKAEFTEAADDFDAIPTVTSDVDVGLESAVPKKELKLIVKGVPAGTKSIEYELTYSTTEQDSQGVFSTARPEKGKPTFGSSFERMIVLGTCSKNVCRYHTITSPIKVSLKFEGDYGARIFQKDYESSLY